MARRRGVMSALRYHDHLALALAEAALLEHERIVVVEEGAELGRTVSEGQEDVGYESGLLLDGQDPRPDVLGQILEARDRKAGDGLRGIRHAATIPRASGRFFLHAPVVLRTVRNPKPFPSNARMNNFSRPFIVSFGAIQK